jgi:hypothetical protein
MSKINRNFEFYSPAPMLQRDGLMIPLHRNSYGRMSFCYGMEFCKLFVDNTLRLFNGKNAEIFTVLAVQTERLFLRK